LVENLTSDPDACHRAGDFVTQLDEIEGCYKGPFKLGLDQSVHTRLSIANRVDGAMGMSRLRVNPLKKAKDDFIPADTRKLVETEAKQKQNLTWAKQGHFEGPRVGRFPGKPFPKSSGSGGRSKLGQGGSFNKSKSPKGSGKSKGRGRGRGRGRGDSDKGPSGGDPE
jgi:hypothetical protein